MGNPTSSPAPPPPAERLVSLDAYRGFIMLVMASGGLGFARIAALPEYQDSPLWQALAFHFDHAAWIGGGLWDMIQPSFMFMVGVAVPYSLAARQAKGQTPAGLWAHTLYRAVVLVLLGIFLSSNGGKMTNYTFVNVLTQIGLGYPFLVLLAGRGWRTQVAATAAILVGYWLYFALPDPAAFASLDVAKDPAGRLEGFFAHWNKHTNPAAAFDVWFLNLFPQAVTFTHNNGGYATLNFIPSLATMILGLIAGELLRGGLSRPAKFRALVGIGLACLAVGVVAGETVCPLVKRIWTPSWAVYSAGWTYLILAAFYGVIDVAGWKAWAFPLVVVGMNSIAMYCMSQLLKSWVAGTWKTHLGQGIFDGTFGPFYQSLAVLFTLWLACLWMYRRKVFLRI
jgi:predicted acyltransferase